jgi:predicted transcriptional regulator
VVNKTKYTFSFTGASALITETLVIAEEYNRLRDWKAVEKSLLDNNLLNKVKQATFKREISEIKKRLSLLTEDQLQLMIQGSLDDAKAMILLSLVKSYSFLRDFIVEVIRNKYLLFDTFVSEIDYMKFVNTKSLSHNELNAITEVTAKKVKQVIFKLLEQVGLITQSKNGSILKPILNSKVIDVIVDDDPALLNAFLFSNEEIKSLLQKLKHG